MPDTSLSSSEAGHEGLSLETMLHDGFVCGILTVDTEGRIIAATGEVAALFRIKPGSASVENLPPPVQDIFREANSSGAAVAERQIVLPSAIGASNLAVTALPLSGNRGGAVALIKNLSSTERLEQSLRRLHRLAGVGMLSASMAHEIKNALVTVRTFVELTLEKDPNVELGSMVRREMARVDSIVTHMLKFGAPAQPSFAPVRLHEILDHAVRLARHRSGSKVITVASNFQAPSDALVGDDRQLEQAFVNLMLNAVESIAEEGDLSINTALVSETGADALHEGPASPGFLAVTIRDTGAGIAPENLRRIFDPFFTTKPHGTGLGLAVTRRIIEEHKGTVSVESQPGEGTTFKVFLPVRTN